MIFKSKEEFDSIIRRGGKRRGVYLRDMITDWTPMAVKVNYRIFTNYAKTAPPAYWCKYMYSPKHDAIRFITRKEVNLFKGLIEMPGLK